MGSPFGNLALSLKAVAAQAEDTSSKLRTAADDAQKYGNLITDLASKTFVDGGGLDIGQAIKSQAKEIDLIRQSLAGDALEAYASYAKQLASKSATPQQGVVFEQWMQSIEDFVRRFGGAAGRDFNFLAFRNEIQQFVRDQQKLLAQQKRDQGRRGSNSGTIGTSPASGTASISLNIFRASGGLP